MLRLMCPWIFQYIFWPYFFFLDATQHYTTYIRTCFYNVNWLYFSKSYRVFRRMKDQKKRSSNMKQKPLQNIVFGTNTTTLEIVCINEITLERKSNSTKFQLRRYQNSIMVISFLWVDITFMKNLQSDAENHLY